MTLLRTALLGSVLAMMGTPWAAFADPDKDESGHGGRDAGSYRYEDWSRHHDGDRYGYSYRDGDERHGWNSRRYWDSYDAWVREQARRDRSSPYFRGRYTRLDIPYGHYPPPGECRIWYPDRPPGHQPPPRDCRSVRGVPRGAWLMRRPREPAAYVYINVRGRSDRNRFDAIGILEAATGQLIREIEGR